MSTQKIKVTILGETYTLVSDESEELIKSSAALVDSQMQELTKKLGTSIEARKIAVLVALQLASKQLAAEQLSARRLRQIERQLDEGMEAALL
jgi:cell division protein ZapA (FtsZ GTPase activity inhibitor)